MSKPQAIARNAEEIVPGVWRWFVHDDRINFESDAHAVVEDGKVTLIDPLPLKDAVLKRLGTVATICLTARCHQRSAWRYRQEFSVKVYAPHGAQGLEEEPDEWYRAGDLLPGGLEAIHTPGPEHVHYAFWLAREPGVLFCPDLLMYGAGQELDFVPAEYHDDPATTHRSVQRLLDFRFSVLCFNHSAPIVDEPQERLLKVLARTPRS